MAYPAAQLSGISILSVQSNSLYSERLPVSNPDLMELADPFESDVNRTVFRLYGLILLFQPGVMLADAGVDYLKGEKLRSQINQLDTAVRDPKANPDLFIQKEISSSIQRYTDRSKAIKTVSGLVGCAGALLLQHALHDFKMGVNANGVFGFLHIKNYTILKVSNVLSMISLGGFCYSVIRRYTEGLQLQADNMALASRISYAKRK